MRITCPSCKTGYRINAKGLPPDKRVVAKCKRCGAKIEVQESMPKVNQNALTTAIYRSRGRPLPEKHDQFGSQVTGQFQFIEQPDQFRGYAGFWKRVAAAIIDMVTLMFMGAFIGGFVGGIYGALTGTATGSHILGRAVGILMGWLYYAIMESSQKQATLGKMAVGIKVIDKSGEAVSFARATARHFSKILSAISLGLGYLAVAFTKKKQGFHDMIAGCLVVNSR